VLSHIGKREKKENNKTRPGNSTTPTEERGQKMWLTPESRRDGI